MMREHYKPQSNPNPLADAALAVTIGVVLAYLLFVYL
jgi:hypothetical protein